MKLKMKWTLGAVGLGLTVATTFAWAARTAYVPPTATAAEALIFNPFDPAASGPVVAAAPAPIPADPLPGRPPYTPPPRSPFLPDPPGPILP